MSIQEITKDFIQNKIDIKEVQKYGENIKVLNNSEFGNILVIDNKIIFNTKNAQNYSESITHSALCIHPNAHNILVVGYDALIVENILKHSEINKITIISSDENIKQAMEDNFVKMPSADKINIIENIDKLNKDDKYDVVIVSAVNSEDISNSAIIKHSNSDSVFVSYSKNHISQINAQIEDMKNIGPFYKILMPFSFLMPLCIDGVSSCILASNKYHPTADLILQKSDLLEDLSYYNSELHSASFVFSTDVRKKYKNTTKN